METTFYEIADEIRILTELINAQTLETPQEEILVAQERLQGLLREKSAGVIAYIKSNKLLISQVKEEEDRLKSFRQAIESRNNKFEDYVKICMDAMDISKVETRLGTISLRKSPVSCKIVDEKLIPKEYKKTVISETVNKQQIIKDFKEDGVVPDGVEILPYNYTVQIK